MANRSFDAARPLAGDGWQNSGLLDVYPNPSMNVATAILAAPAPGPYRIAVHDVLGRLVEERVLHIDTPGQHGWTSR